VRADINKVQVSLEGANLAGSQIVVLASIGVFLVVAAGLTGLMAWSYLKGRRSVGRYRKNPPQR